MHNGELGRRRQRVAQILADAFERLDEIERRARRCRVAGEHATHELALVVLGVGIGGDCHLGRGGRRIALGHRLVNVLVVLKKKMRGNV